MMFVWLGNELCRVHGNLIDGGGVGLYLKDTLNGLKYSLQNFLSLMYFIAKTSG